MSWPCRCLYHTKTQPLLRVTIYHDDTGHNDDWRFLSREFPRVSEGGAYSKCMSVNQFHILFNNISSIFSISKQATFSVLSAQQEVWNASESTSAFLDDTAEKCGRDGGDARQKLWVRRMSTLQVHDLYLTWSAYSAEDFCFVMNNHKEGEKFISGHDTYSCPTV